MRCCVPCPHKSMRPPIHEEVEVVLQNKDETEAGSYILGGVSYWRDIGGSGM